LLSLSRFDEDLPGFFDEERDHANELFAPSSPLPMLQEERMKEAGEMGSFSTETEKESDKESEISALPKVVLERNQTRNKRRVQFDHRIELPLDQLSLSVHSNLRRLPSDPLKVTMEQPVLLNAQFMHGGNQLSMSLRKQKLKRNIL
jgi:hypothetical protein